LDRPGREWLQKRLGELQALGGYRVGRTVESLARELGIEPSEVVKLNSNENFFVPGELVTALLKEVAAETDPRLYPPREEELRLKAALGEYVGLPPECVAIGSGSDQLIELITNLFVERGEEVLSVAPTFPMYRFFAVLKGARYVEARLREDFSLDTEGLSALTTSRTRLCFLCSPNNPTGNQFGVEEVRSVVEGFPGLVVVDEAYVEFARHSVVSLVEKFENLVVLRTFSKAFGLAGLRLGYMVSNPGLARTLSERAQAPYTVDRIALRMGLRMLENLEVVKEGVERLKRERGRLTRELNAIGQVTAFDSQANFVLFQTPKGSEEVHQALLKRGILVRDFGRVLHLDGCLRATVGLPAMDDRLLAALREICGG